MIVFELICPRNHRFEGWFASAGDFDSQRERGLLSCPSCGHVHIDKLPTAKLRKSSPELLPAVREENVLESAKPQTPVRMQDLIDLVLMNTDNVGAEFADVARRIHRQEVPYRNIRGTTTRGEAQELLDEGIPVMALPIPPQNDWH